MILRACRKTDDHETDARGQCFGDLLCEVGAEEPPQLWGEGLGEPIDSAGDVEAT